jgi:NADPH:quinone reductase-like Zn-dependent oxidoreductase
MRAAVVRKIGGPEVVEVLEVPLPEPGFFEVRVKVAAAALNPADAAVWSGYLGPVGEGEHVGLGLDAAGTVGRKQIAPEVPVATAVTRISAPIEQVWRVLVAFDEYARWHPVLSFDAKPEQVVVGTRVLAGVSGGAEEQEVVMTIVAVEAPDRLAWEGGSPETLLGRHSFVLTAQPDGTTEFTESEEFFGPAAPDLVPALGRLTQDYVRFGAALKARVESLSG